MLLTVRVLFPMIMSKIDFSPAVNMMISIQSALENVILSKAKLIKIVQNGSIDFLSEIPSPSSLLQ